MSGAAAGSSSSAAVVPRQDAGDYAQATIDYGRAATTRGMPGGMPVNTGGVTATLVLTTLMTVPGGAASAGTAPELCAVVLARRARGADQPGHRGGAARAGIVRGGGGGRSRSGGAVPARQRTHFDSASVVKVTILGTLLRDAQAAHRSLTRIERALAWAMITRSDNGAASALWDEDGRSRLQRFLNAAGMIEHRPGPGRGVGADPDHRRRRDPAAVAAAPAEPGARHVVPRLRAGPDGGRHPGPALGRPGRGAEEPGRARQERLAAAGPLSAGGSTASAGSLVTARTTASWC